MLKIWNILCCTKEEQSSVEKSKVIPLKQNEQDYSISDADFIYEVDSSKRFFPNMIEPSQLEIKTALQQFFIGVASGTCSTVLFLLQKYPQISLYINDSSIYKFHEMILKVTALQIACINGYREIVKLLLRFPNILLNQPCPLYNRTALHYSILFGQIQIVRILCQDIRINVLIKDMYNQSSLSIADEDPDREYYHLVSTCIDGLGDHGGNTEGATQSMSTTASLDGDSAYDGDSDEEGLCDSDGGHEQGVMYKEVCLEEKINSSVEGRCEEVTRVESGGADCCSSDLLIDSEAVNLSQTADIGPDEIRQK